MAGRAVWHVFKNFFLLCLSFILLPIDTTVIAAISIWSSLKKISPLTHHQDAEASTSATPLERKKTILITGVNMSKGLALARLFHRRGHKVIGADCHSLAIGRFSKALDTFYTLPRPEDSPPRTDVEGEDEPYALKLLEIVRDEAIDLWISVSDVSTTAQDAIARDIIEMHTKAKAIQLSAKDVRNLHEKDAFIEHTRYLGLPVPDSQVVTCRASIVDFLNKRGGLRLKPGGHGTQYLLKPLRVDDLARNDMILLPQATEQETLRQLDSVPAFTPPLPVTNTTKSSGKQQQQQEPAFIMQEFIRGREFCTHALVIGGQVRAFTACPSSSILMNYTALPEESALFRAMLAFTRIMATAGGLEWTGHVSFDFIVKARRGGDGKEREDVRINPIDCDPTVHTAVVLFNDTPALVDEYLSALDGDSLQRMSGEDPIFPRQPRQYYWIGQDLVERVLYPLLVYLFAGTITRSQLQESVWEFVQHVQHWKDGTFEVWDPWPWWWLYHVYWPAQFLRYLVWGRWDKINVSTGKAFKGR